MPQDAFAAQVDDLVHASLAAKPGGSGGFDKKAQELRDALCPPGVYFDKEDTCRVQRAARPHTGGTIRLIMRNLLIVIAYSAIISSEGLIVALLGTISLRTRFQEIISRKYHIRRCHIRIETLTRRRPGNIPMSNHHPNREILVI